MRSTGRNLLFHYCFRRRRHACVTRQHVGIGFLRRQGWALLMLVLLARLRWFWVDGGACNVLIESSSALIVTLSRLYHSRIRRRLRHGKVQPGRQDFGRAYRRRTVLEHGLLEGTRNVHLLVFAAEEHVPPAHLDLALRALPAREKQGIVGLGREVWVGELGSAGQEVAPSRGEFVFVLGTLALVVKEEFAVLAGVDLVVEAAEEAFIELERVWSLTLKLVNRVEELVEDG